MNDATPTDPTLPDAEPVTLGLDGAAVAPKRAWTITELAVEFQTTTRAIRFYESEGLLTPARAGQNRIFTARDRARLKLVLRGRRLGFALADIKEMIDLYDLGDGQVEQMRFTLARSRARLDALRRQRHDLDQAIAELEGGCRALEAALAAGKAEPDT